MVPLLPTEEVVPVELPTVEVPVVVPTAPVDPLLVELLRPELEERMVPVDGPSQRLRLPAQSPGAP